METVYYESEFYQVKFNGPDMPTYIFRKGSEKFAAIYSNQMETILFAAIDEVHKSGRGEHVLDAICSALLSY